MIKHSSAIILAAGKSERIGHPKFALKLNNQKRFIEEIVDSFCQFGCGEIIIVLNEKGENLLDEMQICFPEIVKTVVNPNPDLGRFSSIKTGANCLNNQNRAFLHNVDNPYVNTDVLKLLFNQIGNADYCVPVYGKRGGHPVLLSRNIIEGIINCKENNLNLKEYLSNFHKRTVRADDSNILININTMDEYLKIAQSK